MLNRTELLKLFSVKDFKPLKRFGENYLIDKNIKDKIVSAADIAADDVILEIGPGFGALTMDLASSGNRVIAVEKDRKAYAILKEMAGSNFPDLDIVLSDILDFDISNLSDKRDIKVIANLPYYITTPIIEYLIKYRHLIKKAVLMMQKEVARRFAASPGTRESSSMSVFIKYYCDVEYLCSVSRNSFYPMPEVDSSVIRLDFRTAPPVTVKDENVLFKTIRSAFNQRRKSIINSLSRKEAFDISKDVLSKILREAEVDPAARPENLILEDFARIADNMVKNNNDF